MKTKVIMMIKVNLIQINQILKEKKQVAQLVALTLELALLKGKGIKA